MTDDREGSAIWIKAREQLERLGIDIDALRCGPGECIDLGVAVEGLTGDGPFKVMCLTGNLRDSVDALGDAARDHVVMVRVDEDTVNDLDAWVEAGAVKSRSAAAALFIREGLKVREAELRELEDALDEVEQARERLRRKAEAVLGGDRAAPEVDEAEQSSPGGSESGGPGSEEAE